MVVDDDEEPLQMLKILLQKDGYKVYDFSNPLEAKKFFRINESKFALIITDFCMPDLDGVELISEIQKINKNVKTMIISASKEEIIKEYTKHKNIKVERIIQKPISLITFRNVVNEVINRF